MFNFGLQSVLDCRKTIEEKILVEFSECNRRLAREREALEKLTQERLGLVAQLKKKQGAALNAADLALYVSCIKRLQEREEAQQALVREAMISLESKREELLEAVKEAKMMETLKSQQLKEYNAGILEQERKGSDEVAILRFGRRHPK